MCTSTPKPRTGRILGYVAPNRIPRAPSPQTAPNFLWFPSLRHIDPRTSGHLVQPEGRPAHAQWGPTVGSTKVPGAKKMIFSKVVPRQLGMLKQVFLGRFEPVVARFGRWKIPKCLENGPFGDQQWVKSGAKTHFSKNDPGPYMMLKQVVSAHFEPLVTCFGSWRIPKSLENGPFWDQKGVRNGSKTRFSKSDPGPFEMLKQVFLARFEPVLTQFSPFHHMYAPPCALRTYLRDVWWRHLELREGCRLEDIYYYTPLPVNLANKQQATTTTRHHFVLATAPSHRLGLDFILAILGLGWWPCQIQDLSQKLNVGVPGPWRQVGWCPSKSALFLAKNRHFLPKTALVRVQNSQTKANGCYTARAA